MATSRLVDGTKVSVDLLNDLLQTYMPLRVEWTIGMTSCTLQLESLTVQIVNQSGITVTATSDTMPRRALDPLRQMLRNILQAALCESKWSTMTFGVMLLQLGEEALSHVEAFQASQHLQRLQHSQGSRSRHVNIAEIGWDATSSDWTSILSNPLGVNLLTVSDTAQFLLGKSITEILAGLPSALRVLHVEPVFRSDLVSKFAQKRDQMRERLGTMSQDSLRKCIDSAQLSQLRRGANGKTSSQESMAEFLSTPKVTFHGAPRNVMQSIVRYGFVIPGQKIGQTGVDNSFNAGASFGVGVYSSPSIEFASAYAHDHSRKAEWKNPADMPGMRVVVCATLMGRPVKVTCEETRRREGLFVEQADSHVSPDGLEYIVFDTAQIIPCYVLHLDYGSEEARQHFDAFQKNPWKEAKLQSRLDCHPLAKVDDSPWAKQVKKEALKAAASKWFPYGYGPATGSNFVVEEIGEVSDDEEDYGEFQELRCQKETDSEAQYTGQTDEKKSWFDEFQTVRTTKKQVLIKGER